MHNHIHGMGPSLLMNAYTTRVLDRTEASQRAADVREKLMGAVNEEIEVETDLEADWMVLPGYEAAGYGGRGRKASRSKRDAAGEETGQAGDAVESISVWV